MRDKKTEKEPEKGALMCIILMIISWSIIANYDKELLLQPAIIPNDVFIPVSAHTEGPHTCSCSWQDNRIWLKVWGRECPPAVFMLLFPYYLSLFVIDPLCLDCKNKTQKCKYPHDLSVLWMLTIICHSSLTYLASSHEITALRRNPKI